MNLWIFHINEIIQLYFNEAFYKATLELIWKFLTLRFCQIRQITNALLLSSIISHTSLQDKIIGIVMYQYNTNFGGAKHVNLI